MIGTIDHIAPYLEQMSLGMVDKLYWINKIPTPGVVVDFGCANGAMGHALMDLGYDGIYYGVDESPDMVRHATENAKNRMEFQEGNFINISKIPKTSGPKVLILSSVMHEVYHYGDPKTFWNMVNDCNFDYICIRDMWTPHRLPIMDHIRKVMTKADPELLVQHERVWGGIMYGKRSLMKFLMTYRYLSNWHRELHENYYAFDPTELAKTAVYHHRYILPFIQQQVEKDFDIRLQYNTHYQMILTGKVDL